jgi:ribonuclease P protein component
VAEFGFPKESRLLTAADYKAVFDNSQYKVSCRHFLMLATLSQHQTKRLGMVLAKKNIGKAVQRNRIKRQIRETFRHTHAQFPSLDVVVLARRDAAKLSKSQLTKFLNGLWLDLENKLIVKK